MNVKPSVLLAVIAIPFGLLVAWGGISGNLAAILAALFAQDQLVPVSGKTPAPMLPLVVA